MNNYSGKICPFCKTEFKPTDDIVVCSECDMPHHKDCWVENQGCTTFGCLGTIKALDNEATTVTSTQLNYDDTQSTNVTIYCTKCGYPNLSTDSFCSKCGNKLTKVNEDISRTLVYTQSNPENNNPYGYVNQPNGAYHHQSSYSSAGYNFSQVYQSVGLDTDLQLLIGTKSEYYIPKFQELKSQNKSTSWNWVAFLFTPYWMIYRKMYGYGAAVLAGAFVISLIGSVFLSILTLGGYIVFGILGNNIYMRFLENKSDQTRNMTEPYKSQFIAKNSGVNTMATVLTIIGYALLVVILSL